MFCPLLIFFINQLFRNIIRVSNGLDPDQARHIGGPDLSPNSLQRNYIRSFFLIILAHSILNIMPGSVNFEILRKINKIVAVLI